MRDRAQLSTELVDSLRNYSMTICKDAADEIERLLEWCEQDVKEKERLQAENARLNKSIRQVKSLLGLQEFNGTHRMCDCQCCLAIRKAVGGD